MTKTEAARRLHYMKEPGRDKDNEALELAIKALRASEPGTWIHVQTAQFRCSKCGEVSMRRSTFCQNCGASMR